MHVSRWDVLSVTVERNRVDSRHESWQLLNSGPEGETLNRYIDKVGRLDSVNSKRELMMSVSAGCVSAINENRDSLGIVRASTVHQAYFAENPQYRKPYQPHLIERPGEWDAHRRPDEAHGSLCGWLAVRRQCRDAPYARTARWP